MALSVLIYEDNDPLREGICAMMQLDGRYQVAGSFNNVMGVEQQVKEIHPDIVLMDIDMPGRNGIEAVRLIRAAGGRIPILMLTVFDDTRSVFDAICAGASGYLLKKHLSAKLFDAIGEVLGGGAHMSPSIAHMVITAMQKPVSDPYQLTAREKEILSSLARGNSYKLMAAEYSITIDTVRAHIKNIYGKLQVHSQTEAVSKALRERLV
ncbi:response regulator transcription factor [Fulvivirgaceae bacterium PWU4]|uniref:Response regulator transcription factor n=1 Tax=Chryseosolibacter histidini TaxID=2782349 RepID=A0AAP2DMD4_9BACT|nr:response regulator transcription factor [Chryseosolibacter histidini]MBT1699031.1 response regulator transcription factor [Chryseosolibacter histidini]